jgi:hypothetical protein
MFSSQRFCNGGPLKTFLDSQQCRKPLDGSGGFRFIFSPPFFRRIFPIFGENSDPRWVCKKASQLKHNFLRCPFVNSSMWWPRVTNLVWTRAGQCAKFFLIGSATPCASPPAPQPSVFSNDCFHVHHPITGMTGNSLHMQWPLTSQLHGSFLKENNCFCYGSNSMPLSN